MPHEPFKTNNPRSLAGLRSWLAGSAEPALEPELPIIDPHHHLRENESGRYHLLELAEDLASGHNVRGTVFIDSQTMHRTAGPAWLRPVGETEFVTRALAARRKAGGFERSLQRAIGFDKKVAQYDTGERFVREVVERAGMRGLNLVWSSAEALPSNAEIADTVAWLARVGG